ncbi:Dipeptidyl aminopeptidase A [Pichia kudriavzevii]|uniref:Dipeptidyl aminopeptidase A n=1 Tax=Pichia kudriavzevii TaxID=4909 RepID=A0A1V2LUP0_PICKU|nr:Dipeptidyl aminopeptidase A [Pichia kudriavzevii]
MNDHTVIKGHSLESDYPIGNESDDGIIHDNIDDFDMDMDIENGNPEIDYYPGLSKTGHSFLGQPESMASSIKRKIKKFLNLLNSYQGRKLIIGIFMASTAIVLFALMLFAGHSGGDASLPGGAVHEGNGDGNTEYPYDNEKQNSGSDSGEKGLPENDVQNLAKMSLDDMRSGKFWVFDYNLSKLQYGGNMLNPHLVSVTKDLKKFIVSSESEDVWRHSSLARYWIVDAETQEVTPVHYTTKKSDSVEIIVPLKISYAAFSPDGHFVYFNYNSNLFLKDLKSGKSKQITKDGDGANILNGKPDWVYEEEVLASDRAVYWDNKGSKFAFIKWDDTNVPVYNLELFGDNKYPKILELKYPKPGFPNPVVSLYVYHIESSKIIKVKQPEDQEKDSDFLGKDFIIYQTTWISENELLFKRTDRSSRKIQVCVFDVKENKTKVVRAYNTDEYNGWYKNNGAIYVLPDNLGYIDNVVHEKHDHLAHFKSAFDSEGDLITSGDWDVIGGVVGYNAEDKQVYFIGTSGNSLQRQIYRVSLDGTILTGLTELDKIHHYSLDVSKTGKWGVIKYGGPELPTQKLVELDKLLDGDYYDSIPTLNEVEKVEETLKNFEVPTKEYIPIKLHDDVTVNVIEVKPKDFDESKKYPILVSVYGGPGIQKVSCEFNYGFEEVVSSSLDAIILYIDPRGTGGSGWEYRGWARDNIGYWEPSDITEATIIYMNERESYIDKERVAIWGWSYGGFTTLKSLEFDEGKTFKYGIAVAPVTNWELYDSIYTERYMGVLSEDNKYEDAKISNFEAFGKVVQFLVIHGTADDNVHYQNTLQLLHEFDIAGIENYDVHVFTDSDHSIRHDNANVIVYDKLYNWLATAFN